MKELRRSRAIISLLVALLFCPDLLRASEPEKKEYKSSFAAGLAFTGLLLRKGFKKKYSAEAHFLFGQAGSENDDLSAFVFGLRGYRHFRSEGRLKPYAGVEAAYVMAQTRIQDSSGYLTGGFGGIEYYLSSRFSIGVDIGPYYYWFKENLVGATGGGVDFVVNSFINFYFF